ncbi:hypothetical protein [Jonquetella anthropi]|nr:hypothetical protein [Jonquetella anthropi]EEX47948.1 hypothetical protein GCWU000246_01261 [Jonquetella anthropi E3_33 E1]
MAASLIDNESQSAEQLRVKGFFVDKKSFFKTVLVYGRAVDVCRFFSEV